MSPVEKSPMSIKQFIVLMVAIAGIVGLNQFTVSDIRSSISEIKNRIGAVEAKLDVLMAQKAASNDIDNED